MMNLSLMKKILLMQNKLYSVIMMNSSLGMKNIPRRISKDLTVSEFK